MKKTNPKTKTIVANCICSWLRFWRTWKYIFTFALTKSKTFIFYQSTTERDYHVSAGPKRQPRESDPTVEHLRAQLREIVLKKTKYVEEGPGQPRGTVASTFESLSCLPKPSPQPGLFNLHRVEECWWQLLLTSREDCLEPLIYCDKKSRVPFQRSWKRVTRIGLFNYLCEWVFTKK